MTELRFEFDRLRLSHGLHSMRSAPLCIGCRSPSSSLSTLCAPLPIRQFGEGWYEEILQPNPRVSPGRSTHPTTGEHFLPTFCQRRLSASRAGAATNTRCRLLGLVGGL